MHDLITKSVITIDQDATALDAARVMKETSIGSLLVVNESGKLVGIVTGRDLVLNVMATDSAPSGMLVKSVMTRVPATLNEKDDLSAPSLAGALGRARVRRLPIVNTEGKPVGIVSFEDLLVHCADILAGLGSSVSQSLTMARLTSGRGRLSR